MLLVVMRHITKEKIFLFLLVSIAILMSGYLLIRNPNVETDALIYLFPIHNLFTGKGYTYQGLAVWGAAPGYGLISYIFFMIIKDIELSGMLASSLSYILIIPISYYAIKFIFDKDTAFLSSILIAFSPSVLTYSVLNGTELIYSLFLMLSFYWYAKIILDKNTLFRSTLLGILLGYTILIRPVGIIIVFLALLSLFFFSFIDIKQNKKLDFSTISRTIFLPILVLVVLVAINLPNVLFIHKHTGKWSFTGKTSPAVILHGDTRYNNDYKDQAKAQYLKYERNREKQSETGFFDFISFFVDYIQLRGWDFFGRIKHNIISTMRIYKSLCYHAIYPLVLLCFLYPFFASASFPFSWNMNSRNRRIVLLYIVFTSPILLHLMLHVSTRHVIPYSMFFLSLLAFLTTRFLYRILEFPKAKRFKYFSYLPSAFFIIVFCGLLGNNRGTLQFRNARHGFRVGAIWLHDNVKDIENSNIMIIREPEKAMFYLSGKKDSILKVRVVPDEGNLKEVSALLKRGEIDYLLLDYKQIEMLPQMLPLWNNPSLAKQYGFSLFYKDSEGLFQVYTFDLQYSQRLPAWL